MDTNKKKKAFDLILAGLIVSVINFSESIKLGNVTLSISLGFIVGSVLLIVGLSSLKDLNNHFKRAFYFTIASFASLLIPLVFAFVFDYSQVLTEITKISQQSQISIDDVKQMCALLSNVFPQMMVASLVPSVVSFIFQALVFISIAFAMNEEALNAKFESPTIVSLAKKRVIFGAICTALAFVLFAFCGPAFKELANQNFVDDIEFTKSLSLSMAGILTCSFVILPVAILSLVYIIKYLVSFNQLSKHIINYDKNNTIINNDNCSDYQE